MPTGVVKFYNRKNRFGFIKSDEDGTELYTRQSRLLDTVDTGDKVEFEIEPGRKGPMAVDVRLIEKAASADSTGSEDTPE